MMFICGAFCVNMRNKVPGVQHGLLEKIVGALKSSDVHFKWKESRSSWYSSEISKYLTFVRKHST